LDVERKTLAAATVMYTDMVTWFAGSPGEGVVLIVTTLWAAVLVGETMVAEQSWAVLVRVPVPWTKGSLGCSPQ
jgi:hypothetical protein